MAIVAYGLMLQCLFIVVLAGKVEGVLWTLCNGNVEEKAWDLLWRGRQSLGVLYSVGEGGERPWTSRNGQH
jgi:hypothetical protein